MSDDLVVGGGGSVAVATVTLFDQAQRLERLGRDLEACVRILGAMDAGAASRLMGTTGARTALERAERGIDDARALLGLAVVRSGHLAAGLQLSANVYGAGESALAAINERLAGDVAAGLGFLAARWGLVLAPGLLIAGSRAALASAVASTLAPEAARRGAEPAERWTARHRSLLSDPRFVQFARVSIVSVDDLAAGAAGLPLPVVRLLGDDGLGPLGLDTTVGAVAAGASLFGALRETRVRTVPLFSAPSTRAHGFADRAARVPRGRAQVRIDRYSARGRPDRFEVYLGGTADFSPRSGKEPWDLTSNISALSGEPSGAYRAVVDALDQAGVGAQSPLVVTGYSQGGLVAAQLAASGHYDVRGLYTLGAPSGQVDVPRDVLWVAVEHTDDVVPALGGTWATADPVLVRREVFSDRPPPPELAVPAHAAAHYRATAELIDAANESRLRDARAEFSAVGRGAERVESTWYRASRVP